MNDRKINKHSINFTEEDLADCVSSMYVKLIVERDHPEIVQQAKTLAKQFLESEATNK
jgi:hypothetical protein